jgi:thiol-disulfide isomerase/thioredoxin
VRIVGWLGFLALCLGLAGCNSPGKKTSLPKAASDDRSAPLTPRDTGPPLSQQTAVPAGGTSGMIHGRVIDVFNNTPPADIWIIPPSDGQGAPVIRRAETLQNGYFVVQNLQPGQTYRLIAQTKDRQFQQAGEVTVRPPNVKVVLQVSQDYRPNIPGGGDSGLRPSVEPPVPISPPGAPDTGSGLRPVITSPIPLPEPGSSAGPAIPIRPENFAGGSDPRNGSRDPKIDMPGPYSPRPPHVSPPPAPPKPAGPAASGGGPSLPEPPLAPISATLVPSCDKRGDQLFNLALRGLDGQPWEYQRNRRAGTKLMLLDFWGTWCGWCRVSIKKHIVPLNDLYGRQGLEVIGIAYEQEPTIAAQVRTVEAARRELGINYRVLMGAGISTCPVARDFGINGFPTLVLINDKGQILWEKKAMPSEPEFEQLKVIIRKELGIR